MYNESKTRSLSICLLMLISALGPMASLVSADHDSAEDPLILEWEMDGNWEEVPEYVDPIMDGFMDAGTYEFRFTSMNLTVGCLLYTSPSPRDGTSSRMPSSA